MSQEVEKLSDEELLAAFDKSKADNSLRGEICRRWCDQARRMTQPDMIAGKRMFWTIFVLAILAVVGIIIWNMRHG